MFYSLIPRSWRYSKRSYSLSTSAWGLFSFWLSLILKSESYGWWNIFVIFFMKLLVLFLLRRSSDYLYINSWFCFLICFFGAWSIFCLVVSYFRLVMMWPFNANNLIQKFSVVMHVFLLKVFSQCDNLCFQISNDPVSFMIIFSSSWLSSFLSSSACSFLFFLFSLIITSMALNNSSQ